MGKVVLYMSISLDGFIAGPNDELVRLHDWIFNGQSDRTGATSRWAAGDPKDAEVMDEMFRTTGAVIIGRRTYDISGAWGGNGPVPGLPLFVVTHSVPASVPRGESTYTFVLDGVESAIAQAKAAAGARDVGLMGSAVPRQALASRAT